jgi:hypothetical protein
MKGRVSRVMPARSAHLHLSQCRNALKRRRVSPTAIANIPGKHVPVEIERSPGHFADSEFIDDAITSGKPHPFTQLGVIQQPVERCRDCVGTPGLHCKTGDVSRAITTLICRILARRRLLMNRVSSDTNNYRLLNRNSICFNAAELPTLYCLHSHSQAVER